MESSKDVYESDHMERSGLLLLEQQQAGKKRGCARLCVNACAYPAGPLPLRLCVCVCVTIAQSCHRRRSFRSNWFPTCYFYAQPR